MFQFDSHSEVLTAVMEETLGKYLDSWQQVGCRAGYNL
jgi:hypothetical protein